LEQAAGSDGILPAGFPPAPENVPLLQWADRYWFEELGAPAPTGMPPAPPQLSSGQWAAQYVYEQQQAAAQEAQAAAALAAKLHGATGAVAAAPLPSVAPGASLMQLHSLARVDAMAVCNDGSPAGFYYAAGSDPSTWLVYLQGAPALRRCTLALPLTPRPQAAIGAGMRSRARRAARRGRPAGR